MAIVLFKMLYTNNLDELICPSKDYSSFFEEVSFSPCYVAREVGVAKASEGEDSKLVQVFKDQQASGSAALTLDRITEINGHWTVFFDGNAYKVGDWIDSETIVTIITPTRVQVKRAGEYLVLTVPSSLRE